MLINQLSPLSVDVERTWCQTKGAAANGKAGFLS
jgi:hypothetical protein